MSEQEVKEGRYAFTRPQTITFPNLDEPRAIKNKKGKEVGDPKYSANVEMEPGSDDEKAMKAEAAKVARAKWPGVDLKTVRVPWESGDKVADKAKAKDKNREFSRGKTVLTARSKYQPKLSQVANGKIVDVDGENKAIVKKVFYHGVHGLVQVTFSAYEQEDANGDEVKGVNAYLDMVLSLNKGERLAGGPSAAEVFKGYIGQQTDEDPTGEDEF